MRIEDLEIEELLNATVGGTAYTAPATYYIAALNAAPNAAGGAYLEPSGGSYARIAKTNDAVNFPDCIAHSRTKSNGTAVTFPAASASWGAIVGLGLFVVSPIGTGICKYYFPLPAPHTINIGNVLAFAVGELKIIIPV